MPDPIRSTVLAPDPFFVATHARPWQPVSPGFSRKVLPCPPDGRRVLMLRVEPGTLVGRHRHTGQVQCLDLSGRRLLDTGEVVGPGDYVDEPEGNVDALGGDRRRAGHQLPRLSAAPVQVSGLGSGARKVTTGMNHSGALKADAAPHPTPRPVPGGP